MLNHPPTHPHSVCSRDLVDTSKNPATHSLMFSTLNIRIETYLVISRPLSLPMSTPLLLLQILLMHIDGVEKLPLTTTGSPLLIRCKTFLSVTYVIPRERECHELYLQLLKLSQPGELIINYELRILTGSCVAVSYRCVAYLSLITLSLVSSSSSSAHHRAVLLQLHHGRWPGERLWLGVFQAGE